MILRIFFFISAGDADKCLALVRQYPDEQSYQRLVIRAAFSIIDSLCYKIKEFIYCTAKRTAFAMTAGEEEMLVGFKKKSNNDIVICKQKLSDDVKFVLDITARLFKVPPPSYNDHNWTNFLKAIEIRHRITHPKHPNNLSLSSGEYDIVVNAYIWFSECLNRIVSTPAGFLSTGK